MSYNKIIQYKGVQYNLKNKNDILNLQAELGIQQSGNWGPWQNKLLKRKNEEYNVSNNKSNSKISYNRDTELYNTYIQPIVENNPITSSPPSLSLTSLLPEFITAKTNSNKSAAGSGVKLPKNTRVFLGTTYDVNNKEDVIKLQKSINKHLGVNHLQEDGIYGANSEQALVNYTTLKNYYYNKKKQLKKGEQLAKASFTQSLNGKIFGTSSLNNKGMYQEWNPITKKFKDITNSEKGAILIDNKLYDADTQASELQKLTGQKVTGKWTNENQAYMENLFSNMQTQQKSSFTQDFNKDTRGYKKIIDDYDKKAKEQKQESIMQQSYATNSVDASAAKAVISAEDIDYDSLGKTIVNKIKQDFGIDVSKSNNSEDSNANTTNYSKQYIQQVLNDPVNKKYAEAISYLENSQKYLASLQHKNSKFERWMAVMKDNMFLGALSNLQNVNKNKSLFSQGYKQELQRAQQQNDARIGWTAEDEKWAARAGFAADFIPELIVTATTGGFGGAALKSAKQLATNAAKQAIKEAVKKGLTKKAAQEFVKKSVRNALALGSAHTVRGTTVDANRQLQTTGKVDVGQAAKQGLKEGAQVAATYATLSAIPGVKMMSPYIPSPAVTALKVANFGNTAYLTGMDLKAGYENIKKGNYWSAAGNGLAAGFDILGGTYLNKGLNTAKGIGKFGAVTYQPMPKVQINYSSPRAFVQSVKDRIALNTNFGRSLGSMVDYAKRLSPSSIKQLYSNGWASGTFHTAANATGAMMQGANAIIAPLGKYYLGKTIYNQGFDRDTGDWSAFNIVNNTISDYFSFDPDRVNNARMLTMPISGGFNLNNHRVVNTANRRVTDSFHVTNTMYNTANRYKNLAFSAGSALPMTQDALNNFSTNPFESLGGLYMAWHPAIQGTHNYIQGVGSRLEAVSGGTETPDAAMGAASKLTRNLSKIKQTEDEVNFAFGELHSDSSVDKEVSRLLTYNNADNSTKQHYDKIFSDKVKTLLGIKNNDQVLSRADVKRILGIDNTTPAAKKQAIIKSAKDGLKEAQKQDLYKLLEETMTASEMQTKLKELATLENADQQYINDLQKTLYKYEEYQQLIDAGYVTTKYNLNSNQWKVSSIEDPLSSQTGKSVYTKSANQWSFNPINRKQFNNMLRSVGYTLTGSTNMKDYLTKLQDTVLPYYYSESYQLGNSTHGDKNKILGYQINYNTKQGDFAYTRDTSKAMPGSFLDKNKKYQKVSERVIGDTRHNNDLEELADAYYGIDFYTDRNTRGNKQNFVDANGSLKILSENKQNAKIYNPETHEYEPLYIEGKVNPIIKKSAFASHYDIGLQGRMPTAAVNKNFAGEDILNTGGVNAFVVELNGRRYAMVMDVDGPGSSRRGVTTRLASSPLKHTGNQNIAFELVPLTGQNAKILLPDVTFREFDQDSKSTKYADAKANVSETKYIIENSSRFEKRLRQENKQKAIQKLISNGKGISVDQSRTVGQKAKEQKKLALCRRFPGHEKLWDSYVSNKKLNKTQQKELDAIIKENPKAFNAIVGYYDNLPLDRIKWSQYIDVAWDPVANKEIVITYNSPAIDKQKSPIVKGQDVPRLLKSNKDVDKNDLPYFVTHSNILNKMFLDIATRKNGGVLTKKQYIKYFR